MSASPHDDHTYVEAIVTDCVPTRDKVGLYESMGLGQWDAGKWSWDRTKLTTLPVTRLEDIYHATK